MPLAATSVCRGFVAYLDGLVERGSGNREHSKATYDLHELRADVRHRFNTAWSDAYGRVGLCDLLDGYTAHFGEREVWKARGDVS